MEYSRLEDVVARYRRFVLLEGDETIAREMAVDADPETRSLGEEEAAQLAPRIASAEMELHKLLTPTDPPRRQQYLSRSSCRHGRR